MVFWVQATTGDYVRLKDTFIQRYINERTDKAETRPEEQSEKTELSGEFMEWNTAERAIKAEENKKKWASSVGLCQDTNP